MNIHGQDETLKLKREHGQYDTKIEIFATLFRVFFQNCCFRENIIRPHSCNNQIYEANPNKIMKRKNQVKRKQEKKFSNFI